jgi:hypothetical protein
MDQKNMKEKGNNTCYLDLEQARSHRAEGQNTGDGYYNKVKWWRNVNRFMSIIGLLLVGAMVALIVTGTKQWKTA